MGSSGALCASIYETYSEYKTTDNLQLQAELAQLEGYFHGTSSGIDPLVSYLEQAILIQEDKTIKVLPNLNPENFSGSSAVFLLDTEISRQTTPLVAQYLENGKEESFQRNYIIPIKKLVKEAIESFLGNRENLLEIVKEISALQYIYMCAMIPDKFTAIWAEGLESGNYTLKLCGAGGGGFILGFTSNWEKTRLDLNEYKLRLLYQI
jgi:mevalonate kinase